QAYGARRASASEGDLARNGGSMDEPRAANRRREWLRVELQLKLSRVAADARRARRTFRLDHARRSGGATKNPGLVRSRGLSFLSAVGLGEGKRVIRLSETHGAQAVASRAVEFGALASGCVSAHASIS